MPSSSTRSSVSSAGEQAPAWARGFAAKIAPYATVVEYVNYMAADTHGDRVRAAYGDAKYARLRELKKRYDPDNVFRFNQNIPPSE